MVSRTSWRRRRTAYQGKIDHHVPITLMTCFLFSLSLLVLPHFGLFVVFLFIELCVAYNLAAISWAAADLLAAD